jgi:hypothetical protein
MVCQANRLDKYIAVVKNISLVGDCLLGVTMENMSLVNQPSVDQSGDVARQAIMEKEDGLYFAVRDSEILSPIIEFYPIMR